MESKESFDERLKRVDMHDYFLDKIDNAMKSGNYITASWLIYSCLENRYFRILLKFRDKCKYNRSKSKCDHSNKNTLALCTKIHCVQRLHENNVECIKQNFRFDLFNETTDWVKSRNELMHNLLALEEYTLTDEKFKQNAESGLKLLKETYESCTKFRKHFYEESYIFEFPSEAMEKCPCKPSKPKKTLDTPHK
jgi:hypothetical protein